MKILEQGVNRRSALLGGLAVGLAWAARPLFKSVEAQQASPAITAVKIGQVPTEPDDPAWTEAQAATVTLNPQNITLPRLREAGAKAIVIRALYDSERVALLLEWLDAHKDVDLGTVLQYRDSVAVQLPSDPGLPPSYTMGQAGKGVTIYHWKSDWQYGRLYDVDEAYPNMYGDLYQFSGVPAGEMPEATDYLTKGKQEYLTAAAAGNSLADPRAQETIGAVQKMRAEGFGTIEPDTTQDGAGKGVFQDGGWRIVISMPRQQAKYRIEEGTVLPLAFAAWDGSRSERNGQKAYSFWNDMNLGEAPGGGLLIPLVTSAAGIIVAGVAALIGFRIWHSRRQQT